MMRREIARHGGRGRYGAAETDRRTSDNARSPQRCKHALHPALCKLVACKLSEDWSPEQIAGWQKLGRPEDHTCRVSHETIYQILSIQTRSALKRELLLRLRRAGSVCRPQVAKGQHASRGQIRDASRFESAPPEAEDRAVPGHWEGDLLRGRRLEGLAGLDGGGDPRIRTPPSAGTWIARMRVASGTRNVLLCPTDQATGHSYSTSGYAIVCTPAY